MPVWRCPHCGTPQAESSRCWVCRRSTTTCATCRHFRRGIASGLGLCGLDPRHSALEGTEIRACWVAAEPHPAGGEAIPLEPTVALEGARDGRPAPRTFVPVDELDDVTRRTAAVANGRSAAEGTVHGETSPPPTAVASSAGAAARPSPTGWSLWGDPEG